MDTTYAVGMFPGRLDTYISRLTKNLLDHFGDDVHNKAALVQLAKELGANILKCFVHGKSGYTVRYSTLAKKLKIAERTLSRYIKKLKETGILCPKQIYDPKSGHLGPYRFRFGGLGWRMLWKRVEGEQKLECPAETTGHRQKLKNNRRDVLTRSETMANPASLQEEEPYPEIIWTPEVCAQASAGFKEALRLQEELSHSVEIAAKFSPQSDEISMLSEPVRELHRPPLLAAQGSLFSFRKKEEKKSALGGASSSSARESESGSEPAQRASRPEENHIAPLREKGDEGDTVGSVNSIIYNTTLRAQSPTSGGESSEVSSIYTTYPNRQRPISGGVNNVNSTIFNTTLERQSPRFGEGGVRNSIYTAQTEVLLGESKNREGENNPVVSSRGEENHHGSRPRFAAIIEGSQLWRAIIGKWW